MNKKRNLLLIISGILLVTGLLFAISSCENPLFPGRNDPAGPVAKGEESGNKEPIVVKVSPFRPNADKVTKIVNAGDDVILEVELDDDVDENDYTYQWYKNSTDSNENGEEVTGATNTRYRPPTNSIGTTYYYVVAISKATDEKFTSNTVTLIVVIDAQEPVITVHPVSAFYEVNDTPRALTVTASVSDGGTLSYQWYKKTDGNTDNASGDIIASATNSSYTPLVNTKGMISYFVEVTNTINKGTAAEKTANKRSNVATIGAGVAPIRVTGLTAANKVYDGNDTATITGTPGGLFWGEDKVQLVKGTAKFADTNAGEKIAIIFEDWSLSGDDSDNYALIMPSLTANITKAPGAAVNNITRSEITSSSITVVTATLTTDTGQEIEYTRSNAGGTGTLSTWQSGTTFANLSANKVYVIVARSKENNNYFQGAEKRSGNFTTEHPLVTFVTNSSNIIAPKTITSGQKLALSTVSTPSKIGSVFDCWNINASLTWSYDFDLAVTDNMTLYASWVSEYDINELETKDMVWIQGGAFTMNVEDIFTTDSSSHRVTVSGFAIGKYEVTQEKWTEVMGSNPSLFSEAVSGEDGTPGKCPVEQISWYDALVFCNKLSMAEGLTPVYEILNSTDPEDWKTDGYGRPAPIPTAEGYANLHWLAARIITGANGYRLPTDAQWEYACRAGATNSYHDGSKFSLPNGSENTIVDNFGWNMNNSNSGGLRTHKVGLKTPNAWGLYDMHGNVYEWCFDARQSDGTLRSLKSPNNNNPVFFTAEKDTWYLKRIYRGGAYNFPRWNSRAQVRYQEANDWSMAAVNNDAFKRDKNVGLRLVRQFNSSL